MHINLREYPIFLQLPEYFAKLMSNNINITNYLYNNKQKSNEFVCYYYNHFNNSIKKHRKAQYFSLY